MPQPKGPGARGAYLRYEARHARKAELMIHECQSCHEMWTKHEMATATTCKWCVWQAEHSTRKAVNHA